MVFVGYEGGGSTCVGLGRGVAVVEGEVDIGVAVEEGEPAES